MINKKKMFSKPPVIPLKMQEVPEAPKSQRPPTPERHIEMGHMQKAANQITSEYYQKKTMVRSNSFKPS